jgi:hypothetical protein
MPSKRETWKQGDQQTNVVCRARRNAFAARAEEREEAQGALQETLGKIDKLLACLAGES